MAVTQFTTRQIGSVQRNDFDTTTTGQAVITKLVAGLNIGLTSTGVDAGTGDVTINQALSTVDIPFTDGDTLRRVTITDANVGATSKIIGLVRRPDSTDDSADTGFIYITNVVKVASGSFDILVACLDWGFSDPVENPPNETVKFYYTVG